MNATQKINKLAEQLASGEVYLSNLNRRTKSYDVVASNESVTPAYARCGANTAAKALAIAMANNAQFKVEMEDTRDGFYLVEVSDYGNVEGLAAEINTRYEILHIKVVQVAKATLEQKQRKELHETLKVLGYDAHFHPFVKSGDSAAEASWHVVIADSKSGSLVATLELGWDKGDLQHVSKPLTEEQLAWIQEQLDWIQEQLEEKGLNQFILEHIMEAKGQRSGVTVDSYPTKSEAVRHAEHLRDVIAEDSEDSNEESCTHFLSVIDTESGDTVSSYTVTVK